jgi:hypothetical protein
VSRPGARDEPTTWRSRSAPAGQRDERGPQVELPAAELVRLTRARTAR